MNKKGKFFRLNHYIQAPQVRVINEKGENLGIISKEEALRLAQENDTDLVEISANVTPPVCKLIDFKKFRYEISKKEQKANKGSLRVTTKQIRLRLFMAEADFQRRVEQAKKFLNQGHTVQLKLLFSGRQIAKKDKGLKLFAKAKEELAPHAYLVQESTLKGKMLEMTLKSRKHEKTQNQKSSS